MNTHLEILVLIGPNVRNASLSMETFYRRAHESVQKLPVDVNFLLAVNEGGALTYIREFAQTHDNITVFVPPIIAGEGVVTDAGAGRYIYGLLEASKRAGPNGIVLEIDAEGAHNPAQMAEVIAPLMQGKAQAAFSTRFFAKGARNCYPLQRQLSSLGITLLANAFLGLGRWVPDMASGFEAFRASLLTQLFELHPPQKWITMQTTTAFIQTELRACLLWMMDKTDGKNVAIAPIVYGAEKKGASFPLRVGVESLRALWKLFWYRPTFMKLVRERQQ